MECVAMAEAIKALAIAFGVVGGAFAVAWLLRGVLGGNG